MKELKTLSVAVLLSVSSLAIAQSKNMEGCMDMKGMDMKGMDHKKCMEMMHGDDASKKSSAKEGGTHQAKAVVKSVNQDKGTVTLVHEPVKTLDWPAMTMSFLVKDPALFDKLSPNRKVDVEFVKDGSKYVVTRVK